MGNVLDLDGSLDYQEQFPDIPEGEYDARIDHVENTRIDGDSKYNGNPSLAVYVNVNVQGSDMQARENIILNDDFKWKLCQLFVGTGQQKKGEPLPNLRRAINELAGQSCRVKVVKTKGKKDDRVFTNLTFLEKKQAAWGGGF